MKNILISIANSLAAIVAPRIGRYIRENENVSWFPIIPISESGSYMGISSSGEWVVEVSEGIHHLDKPQLYVYVMVLLERSYNDVYDDVLRILKKVSVNEEPGMVFPFVDIVNVGLEQGSDYWADLAFNWFDSLSKEDKLKLRKTLSKVTNAKWASQKNRQKAKKYLGKYLGSE